MRLALATLWILVVGAITAGVYWTFLITPESTVWSVMASALLALAALLMAGFTASGAIAILTHGASMTGVGRALRVVAGVIPAALIVFVLWWITTYAEAWVAIRSGQISAILIARLGWDDVSWLFTTVHRGAQWVRWVVGALLALSLIAGFVALGWSAVGQFAWVRRALRPRALIVGTFWFVLLIALPWMYLVPWRPKQIPGSSMEMAFIVAKLSASALLLAIGAALLAREVSSLSPPRDPNESAQAA